ncbi:putative diguanylate cyclase AdrA [Pseudoalteromonas sp. P1-9]|uniref:GGDEF domain-containing protein n=1 Tax=Pseudoalteromonas sp. P1-9 TaxID=1710354 RepID=UPI0006D62FD7|nr:GGDEF domain-containing protein [Pseudoalteromonas sp. P1-9]KPV96972.1 putative diguanylate cyclase AdrA [Pseudoalteromonas sp. P1-9]
MNISYQEAVGVSSTIEIIACIFALFILRSVIKDNKETPYLFGYFISSLLFFYFLNKPPLHIANTDWYLEDLIGTITSLLFGLTICKKSESDKLSLLLLVSFAVFTCSILFIENHVFYTMLFSAYCLCIALISLVKVKNPNQADKGLVIFLVISLLVIFYELSSIPKGISRREYFETDFYYLLVYFSSLILVLTVFIFTSQLINLTLKYKALATQDALTGLYNRTAVYNLVNNQLALAKRNKQTCSVLMLDIDHFKQVNDQHGHQQGDDAIKLVAEQIQHCTREYDISCRYGGEEFFIFLTYSDENVGFQIAERIRKAVTEQSKDKLYGPLTISVGLTQFKETLSVDENIDIADKALYASKQAGRNQTTLS